MTTMRLAAVGAGRRVVPGQPRARRGRAPIADPRGAVRRAVAALAELDLEPIVGPELEFFLVERDRGAAAYAATSTSSSMVYTVGPQADPGGLVRGMAEAWPQLGLGAFAVNHEFMNGQYEINLRHADALTAADRAFRLKSAVKDIAAQHGLLATFMGKPFNDQGGSGTHLHLSLNRDGRNAFDAPRRPTASRAELRAFAAGVLAHAPGADGLLNPTINAYRRIGPTRWRRRTRTGAGTTGRRSSASRPSAAARRGRGPRRRRRRNPYLAIAACSRRAPTASAVARPAAARRGRRLPRAPDVIGARCPRSLEEALDALEADDVRAALGREIVETFLAVKRFEVERHRAWVSDWEIDEYLHHL